MADEESSQPAASWRLSAELLDHGADTMPIDGTTYGAKVRNPVKEDDFLTRSVHVSR